MAENQILPFAQGQGANVLSQSDYAGDSMRLQGHQPGVARSALENKALLQCSSMASGLAQFIADGQADDVTDAKTPAEIAAMLQEASAANMFSGNRSSHIIFANGQIIQWFRISNNAGAGTVLDAYATLPIAFPNVFTACVAGKVGNPDETASAPVIVSAIQDGLSRVRYRAQRADKSALNTLITIDVIAIGN